MRIYRIPMGTLNLPNNVWGVKKTPDVHSAKSLVLCFGINLMDSALYGGDRSRAWRFLLSSPPRALDTKRLIIDLLFREGKRYIYVPFRWREILHVLQTGAAAGSVKQVAVNTPLFALPSFIIIFLATENHLL